MVVLTSQFTIPSSIFFPSIEYTDEDGILAIGGNLTPTIILDAITHGIFPWPIGLTSEFTDENNQDEFNTEPIYSGVSERTQEEYSIDEEGAIKNNVEEPITSLSELTVNASWNNKTRLSLDTLKSSNSILAWWAPESRAILDLEKIHVPKRLRRTMNSGKFIVTHDKAFPEVMIACATAGERQKEGSWITREFFDGYCKLFELGFAHSVECWIVDEKSSSSTNLENERPLKLVGGVYGVAVNGFFDGESMFCTETDASKVALFSLLIRLAESGFKLFDLQILNQHTQSLGGFEIPRNEYQDRLNNALRTLVTF